MGKDKKYSVYIHTNKNNGKNYIGMTSTKPERRWGRQGEGYLRIKNGKYCQPAFANAILKYGWDSFQHEIIATNLTFEEASELEIQKISELSIPILLQILLKEINRLKKYLIELVEQPPDL